MPKQVLHSLLANHQDVSYQNDKSKKSQLHTATINCHAENLVVESPFTELDLAIHPVLFKAFQIRYAERAIRSLSLTHFFFELRGPPIAS